MSFEFYGIRMDAMQGLGNGIKMVFWCLWALNSLRTMGRRGIKGILWVDR